MSRPANLLRQFAWHASIVLLSLGAAGLVVVLDHPATDDDRPELTARADAAFQRAIPAIRVSLTDLAAAADSMAAFGREAGTSLRAMDTQLTRDALTVGEDALVASLEASGSLAVQVEGVVVEIGASPLGASNRARVVAIRAAVRAGQTLTGAWPGISSPLVAAATALDGLADHDDAVLQATAAARDRHFGQALAALDEAQIALQRVHDVQQALQSDRDVSTLVGWVERSGDYDTALIHLYAVLEASRGAQTPESVAALEAVNDAQAALPTDDSGLTIIVSEVTEPDSTEGLLAIERARGAISAAVAALAAVSPR